MNLFIYLYGSLLLTTLRLREKKLSDPYGHDHGKMKGDFCHWFSWESNQAVVTANKLCLSEANRRDCCRNTKKVKSLA